MDTGMLHAPLPLHKERSLEAAIYKKPVLERKALWPNGEGVSVVHQGLGSLSMVEGGKVSPQAIRLIAPFVADKWPDGASPDGDYVGYGASTAVLEISGQNWEQFNRVAFWVKPECDGMRVNRLEMGVVNEGKIKVPDIYFREGSHQFDLVNHEWNYCIWEFNAMSRDKITKLTFSIGVNGRDTSTGDSQYVELDGIELQQVAESELEKGWIPAANKVAFSTTGYFDKGKKTAVVKLCNADKFSLLEEQTGEVCYTAPVKEVENFGQKFGVLDFSDFEKQGRYSIKIGEIQTESFAIGTHILKDAAWRVTNFLFCERCGYPVPRRHGICHHDITAKHHGVSMPYNGGWHDAGDLSQQTAQSAEVVHALFETAQRVKADQPLYLRLMEEAEWGLEFLLKTRFGDGYRATSAPATRWTNGLTGDMDDIPARVHNHSFENFLMAGVQAYSAYALRERDSDLAFKCMKAAKEDFSYALNRFFEVGMELPIAYEHTYNSSLSQYYATISWSASNLYLTTQEECYGATAREYAKKMLLCQETGESNTPLSGFFYRDETKKAIVHFNHQSREQVYMQALVLLCETQAEHPDKAKWENAMRLHGQYLKTLMQYTAPYGMLPAGIHAKSEVDDAETFRLLHLMVNFETERQNYVEQLASGIPLDEEHCVRCFPIWFSFRGNAAVMLASGKSAALLGNYFNDSELIEIAREQLYWMLGKNPFSQSLMYGEGSNFASQYAGHAGEMVGELPVGIETAGNEDAPYWPQNTNATYKEVWTTSAGRFLWVLSELY